MVFRIEPQGPAAAYQTFAIRRPRAPDAWVPATCEDIDCEAWRLGWITRVPVANQAMVSAVLGSGRPYTETTAVDQAEREFLFPPGTPCFKASTHRQLRRPDIPDLFVVRAGDWRGNPTGERRVHTRPEDWAEHFQEATVSAAQQIEKG
jgi:hypothetical protein